MSGYNNIDLSFFFFVLHKMSFIQFKIEYIPKNQKQIKQTNKQKPRKWNQVIIKRQSNQ